jgi:hypothetical protein
LSGFAIQFVISAKSRKIEAVVFSSWMEKLMLVLLTTVTGVGYPRNHRVSRVDFNNKKQNQPTKLFGIWVSHFYRTHIPNF